MTRRIAWPLVLTCAATITFLLATSPAQAATGCGFTAPIVTVTIDPNTSATLKRSGSAIQLNGFNCGTATIFTTDAVLVTGASGSETFTVNLTGGPFAPGLSTEPGGAADIEIEVDLGGQFLVTPDKLVVQGTGNSETYRLGNAGVNLNDDDDADITGPAASAIAATNVELFSLLGAAGNDTISGDGAVGGAVSPVPAPISLDLQGGPNDDILTGGSYADTITGGLGTDQEAGGDGTDRFVEDAAANGNDTISGGAAPDDKLDYGARTAGVNVILDGVANDGQPGVELDNVQSDVESFTLGSGNDVFGAGSTGVLVLGGAGADTLDGSRSSDTLLGGGNDDIVDGFFGNDYLAGGMGNDQLTGDRGSDYFFEDLEGTVNGADDISGGASEDTVVYQSRPAGSYKITLDNAPNDGLDSVPGGRPKKRTTSTTTSTTSSATRPGGTTSPVLSPRMSSGAETATTRSRRSAATTR